MRIAVTTPTGNVGQHLVRLLLQAGVRPKLLLRDAAGLDAHIRERCDIAEVDQGDAGAVTRATEGVDTLYWVNPPTTDDNPLAGHARMANSAARAVTENGIARVVFQSSVGAEARGGLGDIDGLGNTEQLLQRTDAAVTHLRCGYFFTNLLMDLDSLRSGTLATTLPLDFNMPWVDPRDVAAVAAVRLLNTQWGGQSVQAIHGAADLSFSDVARIITEATGIRVRAEQVTDDDVAMALRSLGLTAAQVEAVVGMSRGLRNGFVPENPRDVTSTTPTRLEAWAYEVLRPLLAS